MCVCVSDFCLQTNYKNQKKPKRKKIKSKRMSRIIRERMQTFAYVHQIGRMRILGTMVEILAKCLRTTNLSSMSHEKYPLYRVIFIYCPCFRNISLSLNNNNNKQSWKNIPRLFDTYIYLVFLIKSLYNCDDVYHKSCRVCLMVPKRYARRLPLMF